MERRAYGDTGVSLSLIGFGGIVVNQTEEKEARQLVSEAVDHGVNYFDVAPTYGNAQERLGPALEPYRKDIFLACKTTERRREGAKQALHDSLKTLRTDHFDLYQLHSVNTPEDLAKVTGPGGALEALVAARDEGLIRFLGFSSHSVPTAQRLLEHFHFDSVLFPVNWTQYLRAGFGPQVVARAQEKRTARLALKALARAKLADDAQKKYAKCWYEPIDDPELADMALRYSLSQPITAALPPGEAELFRRALKIAVGYTPITEDEVDELRRLSAQAEPFFDL
jgi:aryl-alcohol dehydrogenase-like predicted oxidoreductase